ncbi:hypothetical protein PUR26_01810 [Streptomyces sp. SP18CS02]|nr:hypothetical protein [Streptomyces sp. SP18CS02]
MDTHEIPDHELGKAVRYGIYDSAAEQWALTARLTVRRASASASPLPP